MIALQDAFGQQKKKRKELNELSPFLFARFIFFLWIFSTSIFYI